MTVDSSTVLKRVEQGEVLRGEDLRELLLEKAVLVGARFPECNLASARLMGAELNKSDLMSQQQNEIL